jgi:hypothetical protein
MEHSRVLPHKQNDMRSKRRQASSKIARREMLMTVLANEIADTWIEEEVVDLPKISASGNSKPKGRVLTAEDLFYAQINGEQIEASYDELPDDERKDECDDDSVLQGSFGALALPEVVVSSGVDLMSPMTSPTSTGSRGITRTKMPNRPSIGSLSSHSNSSGEDTLSIQEIQDFVMKNMPVDVREKIPQEAWARIFGKTLPDKIRKPAMPTTTMDDDEDASVISDISGRIGRSGALTETQDSTRTPQANETDWDEDVCPGLENTTDHDVNNRSVKSAESSTESDRSCRIDRITAIPSAMANTTTESSGKQKHTVNFSHVGVRYYERVLEINPAVTNGPAIGIGWRYKRGGDILVDDWEAQRAGMARSSNDLILARPAREAILIQAGYTQKQIVEALRIIRKAKDRRKVTAQNLGTGAEAMEETIEAAARRFIGLLSFGKRKGLV